MQGKDAETTTLNAVQKYKDAAQALSDYMQDEGVHEVLQEYASYIEDYNMLLDAAIRAVKTQLRASNKRKLTVGGLGAQKKMKRWYDIDVLSDKLPAKQSELFLTEKVIYELDENALNDAVRQGAVDIGIVQKAYHEVEQNPSNLPGTPKPYSIPALVMNDEG